MYDKKVKQNKNKKLIISRIFYPNQIITFHLDIEKYKQTITFPPRLKCKYIVKNITILFKSRILWFLILKDIKFNILIVIF